MTDLPEILDFSGDPAKAISAMDGFLKTNGSEFDPSILAKLDVMWVSWVPKIDAYAEAIYGNIEKASVASLQLATGLIGIAIYHSMNIKAGDPNRQLNMLQAIKRKLGYIVPQTLEDDPTPSPDWSAAPPAAPALAPAAAPPTEPG